MARLPQPGGDEGSWGQVLNDYLGQSHEQDGSLKENVVTKKQIAPNSIDSTGLGVNGGLNGQVLTKDTASVSGLAWKTLDASVPDASTIQKGTIRLSGDIAGTAEAPTVPGLADKEPQIVAGLPSQYWRGDKTWQTLDKAVVSLGNVDNTSDVSKPLSTAAQEALGLKVDTAALDVDTTLAANSDSKIATQKATKAYIDTQIASIPSTSSIILIDTVNDLPAGTPAGTIVVVKQ